MRRLLCWMGLHPYRETSGIEHADERLVVFRKVCPRCGDLTFTYIDRPGRNLA